MLHIYDIKTVTWNGGGVHYFIEADAEKEEVRPDFSGIIGRTVSCRTDRPLGTRHPRFPDIVYPVNYGYAVGIFAADGSEQDVYLLGVNEPVQSFTGKVTAVWHRYNDIEDKWIVAPENTILSDSEILAAIDFQENFFDGELFR